MIRFDLGDYSRPVSGGDGGAQAAFDDGLVWLYGFNHEAAEMAFGRAVAADPGCGLAYWGIAYGAGPNYNHSWETFTPQERAASVSRSQEALRRAHALRARVTPVEAALIEAVAARVPGSPEIEDFAPLADAYAAAMRQVQAIYPDDLDVAALTAEALMLRTPWALWDIRRGVPAEGADTLEARAILEAAFARLPGAWRHPGCLHLYIHLMEMSPTPEVALRHGDALTGLAPDSGHLEHMATHIDVLCGDYHSVVARNRRAAEADKAYVAVAGAENFYTLYRLHNLHFELYGALFLGQPGAALRAAEALEAELPEAVVRVYPDLFEAFLAGRVHTLLRFGLWDAVLEAAVPEDPALYSYTRASWAYGRCVALANLGRPGEAEAAYGAFCALRDAIPEERLLFQNSARDVLAIADAMALGEMAFKSGNRQEGLAHLREAVRRDDGLLYEEPWAWMLPARHALGALLLEAGLWDEAEAVYRADLGLDATLPRPCQHPGNVWALHGLDECLSRRGETVERPHIRQQLERAQARAEVPIRASCFCRGGGTVG